MRRSLILAAVIMSGLIGSLADAQPVTRLQVGILECRGGSSVGFIVGSVTNLGCVLRVPNMPDDFYVATIRKIGVDLGITQESALAWNVWAPVLRNSGRRGAFGQLCRRARFGCARHRRRRRMRWWAVPTIRSRCSRAQRAGPGRPQRRSGA